MSSPPATTALHWLITDYSHYWVKYDLYIFVITDIPVHLHLRWTYIDPLVHLHETDTRGLTKLLDPKFCFVQYRGIHQSEPGDTLEHSFVIPNWQVCNTRYFVLYGTIADLPTASNTNIFQVHAFDSDIQLLTLLPLQNGSFELWVAGLPLFWGFLPDYWTNRIQLPPWYVFHGNSALQMSGMPWDKFAILAQHLNAIPYRGKGITFKGWGKQLGFYHPNMRFEIRSDGTPPIYALGDIPASYEYSQITLKGKVPLDATWIDVRCVSLCEQYGPEWCCFDYLTLFLTPGG